MSFLETCSLNSGSNGNCLYVEKGATRILFDAGISAARAKVRLAAMGRRISDVTALVISHDHSDHVGCAGIYQRKFGLPIYITPRTFEEAGPRIGKTSDIRFFAAGDRLRIGDIEIETIPTPHDGVDGAIFVLTDGHRRLGIFTDLGHPFHALAAAMQDLDFVYLESNYDPEMLDNGPYPEDVKARIRGAAGHLSNEESALLVQRHASTRLRTVVLSHLSGDNNTPRLALQTHRRIVSRPIRLAVARRDRPSELFSLG